MANAKVSKTAAFWMPLTLSLSYTAGNPTQSIHTIEVPPEPVLMAPRMHARLLVINPKESS